MCFLLCLCGSIGVPARFQEDQATKPETICRIAGCYERGGQVKPQTSEDLLYVQGSWGRWVGLRPKNKTCLCTQNRPHMSGILGNFMFPRGKFSDLGVGRAHSNTHAHTHTPSGDLSQVNLSHTTQFRT